MPLQKLDDKYRDININQYEATDIMWKKLDEIVQWCNTYELIIDKLKEEINTNK